MAALLVFAACWNSLAEVIFKVLQFETLWQDWGATLAQPLLAGTLSAWTACNMGCSTSSPSLGVRRRQKMETRWACPRNPRESIQTERQLLSIPANPEAKLSFDGKFQFSVLRLFPMQIQNNFRIRKLQKACSGCRCLRNHLWETPAWTSCLLYFLQGGISHLHVPDMPFIA